MLSWLLLLTEQLLITEMLQPGLYQSTWKDGSTRAVSVNNPLAIPPQPSQVSLRQAAHQYTSSQLLVLHAAAKQIDTKKAAAHVTTSTDRGGAQGTREAAHHQLFPALPELLQPWTKHASLVDVTLGKAGNSC